MTMQWAAIIFSGIFLAVLFFIIIKYRRKPLAPYPVLNDQDRLLLYNYVSFYREISLADQQQFEHRLHGFLSHTKITGVKISVEKIDELLIAASAIIPVFAYPTWQYMNLNEVLLYPGSFDRQFNQQGDERDRAGMVGDGPFQNIMILSQPDLRAGFFNVESMFNTGIHEFVHLIDKTDGAIDGVPESLLDNEDAAIWLELVKQNIIKIHLQQSDIDAYGATNRAEFFAVVSEYFFKQPDLLQINHPELYQMLTKIYRYRY